VGHIGKLGGPKAWQEPVAPAYVGLANARCQLSESALLLRVLVLVSRLVQRIGRFRVMHD
jgi:hypothetical protein